MLPNTLGNTVVANGLGNVIFFFFFFKIFSIYREGNGLLGVCYWCSYNLKKKNTLSSHVSQQPILIILLLLFLRLLLTATPHPFCSFGVTEPPPQAMWQLLKGIEIDFCQFLDESWMELQSSSLAINDVSSIKQNEPHGTTTKKSL
jgi:hypothetical protein